MIYVGSRYEREDIYFTLDSRSGNTRPTVMRTYPAPRQRTAPTRSVRWQEGARIDRVSARLFGAPERWWRLMDANPDILDPMEITVGTTVVLP